MGVPLGILTCIKVWFFPSYFSGDVPFSSQNVLDTQWGLLSSTITLK